MVCSFTALDEYSERLDGDLVGLAKRDPYRDRDGRRRAYTLHRPSPRTL